MIKLRAAALCIVAMYGDSTIWGTTLTPNGYQQSAHNEPAGIQWTLPQATIENHGVPGSSCSNLLWGQPPIQRSWAAEMAASKAAIVVVNEAINDAYLPATALSDADFSWCYQQLAGIARAYGKIFIIETPNPITDTGHDYRLWSLVVDETTVAAQNHIFVIDQWNYIINNYPNWQASLPDGIHPNDNLYEFKANLAIQLLAPLVDLLP